MRKAEGALDIGACLDIILSNDFPRIDRSELQKVIYIAVSHAIHGMLRIYSMILHVTRGPHTVLCKEQIFRNTLTNL